MDSGTLLSRLMDVRRTSEMLIEPLEAEEAPSQASAQAALAVAAAAQPISFQAFEDMRIDDDFLASNAQAASEKLAKIKTSTDLRRPPPRQTRPGVI